MKLELERTVKDDRLEGILLGLWVAPKVRISEYN